MCQEMVITNGVMQMDDCLLEGHLGITKELVAMQTVQKRFYIGAENGGCGLIKVCIHKYVLSNVYLSDDSYWSASSCIKPEIIFHMGQ